MLGNKFKNNKGFSLMELIVSIALFSILVIVIVNVYLVILSAQRQASFRQNTVSNLRYVLEKIAQDIRSSEIDYGRFDATGFGAIISPTSSLELIRPDGTNIRYKTLSNEVVADIDGQLFSLTNSEDFNIVNLDFYITPTTSPFLDEACTNDSECNTSSLSGLGCSAELSSTQVGFCKCDSNDDCKTDSCDAVNGFCVPKDKQPSVTILVGFESRGFKASDEKIIFLQTNISSRNYQR